MDVIDRIIKAQIDELLTWYPAVALVGPRQIGKTTLAKRIASTMPNVVFFDMEISVQRAQLENAEFVLPALDQNLVVIDEVQRLPQLFTVLRPLIDQNRQQGRFLLLGSASPVITKGVSESLAGRIAFCELSGLLLAEVGFDTDTLNMLWLRGGFPGAYLAHTDAASFHWRTTFLNTFAQLDLPHIGYPTQSASVARALLMLCHLQGQPANYAMLAQAMGTGHAQAKLFINLLEGSYIIRALYPWFNNAGKRLVKSPKLYIRDSGLLHAGLEIASRAALMQNPAVGFSWEGFVIEQIARTAPSYTYYYYRTQKGAECDLVIARGMSAVCVEIKLSSNPTPSKGFYETIKDIKPTQAFFIGYGLEHTYQNQHQITITNLTTFLTVYLPSLFGSA